MNLMRSNEVQKKTEKRNSKEGCVVKENLLHLSKSDLAKCRICRRFITQAMYIIIFLSGMIYLEFLAEF